MEQMSIFVKDLQGKTHTINISDNDDINILKQKIERATGVPTDMQRLQYQGRDILSNENNLKSNLKKFKISNQSTIHLLTQLKGGSMSTLQFNSIERSQKNYFHRDAPKWRTIRSGMTVEGSCLNQECEARNQNVWVPHKFGIFNLSKIVHKCVCPACGQKLINVNNIAFYMCKWRGEGSQSGAEIRIPEQEHTDGSCFVSFKNGDEDQRCWDYLEFQVEKL